MHQNTSIPTVAAKEPAPPDMETAVITAAIEDDVKPAAAGQNRRSVRRYFFAVLRIREWLLWTVRPCFTDYKYHTNIFSFIDLIHVCYYQASEA